jgi:hypothetical protein
MKQILSGLVLLAGAAGLVTFALGEGNADCFTFDNREICTEYTDSTAGEDLIIKSDSSDYGSFDSFTAYVSVENVSGVDQDVDVSFLFENDKSADIAKIYELKLAEPYDVEEPIYQDIDGICPGDVPCKVPTQVGTKTVTKFKDTWKPLVISAKTKITKQFVDPRTSKNIVYKEDSKTTYNVPAGMKRFFKAEIDMPNRIQTGQFIIIATGSQGAHGQLDPWFSASYAKCRKLTTTAGGDSGGMATTTTTGFALVATNTFSGLAATSSGGYIYEVNTAGASTTPTDFVVTNGTDCNSDGGAKIDFYFEEYDKTTGKFVLWVEATDVSSTSAKTVLMYYGYSDLSATDQQNADGVFGREFAVYNMSEDPSGGAPQLLDKTTGNRDFSTVGSMTSSDRGGGFVDGSIDFDGVDDGSSAGQSTDTMIGSTSTVSVWIKPTDSGNSAGAAWDLNTIIGSSGQYCGLTIGTYNSITAVWGYTYAGGQASSTFSVGEWNHIVWTHTLNPVAEHRMYLNGNLVDVETAGGCQGGSYDFQIGGISGRRYNGILILWTYDLCTTTPSHRIYFGHSGRRK